MPEPESGSPGTATPGKARGRSRELPVLVVVALVLALVVKAFLVQAFFIPSGSMERTLHGCPGCQGDRVLVNKVVYRTRDVHRGEVVVFSGEGSWGDNGEVPAAAAGNVLERAARRVGQAIGVGPPAHDDYIKRVIGLPGDRVACCTAQGQVTVQPAGAVSPVPLDEPYVFEDDSRVFCEAGVGASLCPAGAPGVLVPPGRLWVMGDHRGYSADSRAHLNDPGHGTIPVDEVVGRAFVVVWPFGRARTLPVPSTFQRLGP